MNISSTNLRYYRAHCYREPINMWEIYDDMKESSYYTREKSEVNIQMFANTNKINSFNSNNYIFLQYCLNLFMLILMSFILFCIKKYFNKKTLKFFVNSFL